MLGPILAFATAVSEASKDVFSKYNLRHIDEYVASFSMHLVQTALLVPIVVFTGWEPISLRFMLALASATVIQLIVILLYMKALKGSELSASIPLITLTPLFMLLTSPVLVGQFPNGLGILGIVLIVAGTYTLNMRGNQTHVFAPFLLLFKNKGSRYMMLVAFLWSITANIDKIGVEETSPIFWAFTKDSLIMAYLVPIVLWRSEMPLAQMKARAVPLLMVGVFRTASVVLQMFALQFILVAYVIAIKRSSALLIIIWAFSFMGERQHFFSRFIGMVIILMGLVMIAVS